MYAESVITGTNNVACLVLTAAEYAALTPDPNTYYITSDTQLTYLGSTQLGLTILRTVLWMNQTTYDAIVTPDADTQYIIDDDLANGVTETIYTAWP